jgi:3-isopropylmalate dehydratase small subunit
MATFDSCVEHDPVTIIEGRANPFGRKNVDADVFIRGC